MADVIYTVVHNGEEIEVVGPKDATPEQLNAFLTSAADVPKAKNNRPPDVPLPSDFVKPPDVGGIDTWKKSLVSAFGEGWNEGRGGDRVLGLNPENRGKVAGGWYDLPASSLRAGLEIAEGLYGGIKRATGQAIYNSGLSQSSPATIADSAFELPELWSLTAGMNPAGLFRIPASGLSLTSRIPVVGPTIARRSAERAAAARAEQIRRAELQALADRHGVNLLPADVGGPVTRGATAGSRQTIVGGALVDNAATRANTQMSGATRAVADQQGQVLAPRVAGEGLQESARDFARRSSEIGNDLYTRAGVEAGNVRIDPQRAIAEVGDLIQQLRQSQIPGRPPSAEISALIDFRDRLSQPNGLSYTGMKDILSEMKTAGRSPDLLTSRVNAFMRRVAAAGQRDMHEDLVRAGRPRAASLYNRANVFWRDRVERIEEALEPILGAGKSGEDALQGILTMAGGGKGGVRRLSNVLGSMRPADANNARATIISRLGMGAPGQQNAAQDVFNTSTFLTNWSKLSAEGKRALFRSNPTVARELDDLARIAEAKKITASYANTSNTGRAANFTQALSRLGDVGAVAFSGAVLGLAPTIALAAVDIGSGALLASPGFARILANAPRTAASAAQRQRVLTNLRSLAAREPGLAPYIDKVSEAVSNPQPPPVDYTTLGPSEPVAPNFSKLSPAELAEVLRAQADSDLVLANPEGGNPPETAAPVPGEAPSDTGEE